MKAIRMHTQGGPELLAYEDGQAPIATFPNASEDMMLIRLTATSLFVLAGVTKESAEGYHRTTPEFFASG